MEKRYKIFRWTFVFLFIMFMTLYFSQLTGYYEYRNYQKMVMTEEQIKQFEQDIKDGKEVDIKDYTISTARNYENSFSNLGLNLSKFISGLVKDGVIKLFGSIAGMVSN